MSNICHYKELHIPDPTGGHLLNEEMNALSPVKPGCVSWVSCDDVFRQQQHLVMSQMCISSRWSWQATSLAARDLVMI